MESDWYSGLSKAIVKCHIVVYNVKKNIRSGFKTSDQVQRQGVRPIGKAQHT